MREKSIQVRSNASARNFIKNQVKIFKMLSEAEESNDWSEVDDLKHDQQDCLGITIKKQIEILLSWGGPASKIVYDIDTQNADYYFQDWWKPWTKAKLSIKNQKLLNDYMLSAYSSVIDEPEYYENKD